VIGSGEVCLIAGKGTVISFFGEPNLHRSVRIHSSDHDETRLWSWKPSTESETSDPHPASESKGVPLLSLVAAGGIGQAVL
jgi:hypothetical protein